MRVFVKSFATVVTTGRIAQATIDLPDGATAAEAMRVMGIGSDEETIVLINQRPSTPESPLSEGDSVTLMPPVSAA